MRRKRTIKEQVRDVKVKGLPNAEGFSSRIQSSGASPEEILGWFGAVMGRLGMSPSAAPEVAEPVDVPPPAPEPSAAAIEENFENELLDSLLKEINKGTRKRKR